MINQFVYETRIEHKKNSVRFYFESFGKTRRLKIVEYSAVGKFNSRLVFNLGLADFDLENNVISDAVNSNNGDLYVVFNTVLSTVPIFFERFPNGIIVVGSSDNGYDFVQNCKLTCRKKCKEYCKNTNRRIRIYRYFVEKNLSQLKDQFYIFGKLDHKSDSFEAYVVGREYTQLLVGKKN